MNVSTKGRYGVKAMLSMTIYHSGEAIPVRTIAERENIPEKYLQQLVSILKKAGLVKSVRGQWGGYSLAKAPEEITVGEIISALEGDLAPVDCVIDKKEQANCNRSEACITRFVWAKIRDGISSVLHNITLKDLADGYNKEITDSYMFYI